MAHGLKAGVGVSRASRSLVWLCLVCTLFAGCMRPPQIVTSEEGMTAVDALWTAVTARRADLLAQSKERITQMHSSGVLDGDAFEMLSGIIKAAEAGHWEKAAKNLKWFIQGQRAKR